MDSLTNRIAILEMRIATLDELAGYYSSAGTESDDLRPERAAFESMLLYWLSEVGQELKVARAAQKEIAAEKAGCGGEAP